MLNCYSTALALRRDLKINDNKDGISQKDIYVEFASCVVFSQFKFLLFNS